jgi:multiple sugar transport system permease protein
MTVTAGEAVGQTARGTEPTPTNGRERLDPGQSRRGLMLITPTLLALTIVIVYPIFRAIYMSFQQDSALVNGVFVAGGSAGFSNYTMWLTQNCGGGSFSCPPGTIAGSFWSSVYVTFLFTVITVTIEIVLGLWFATIMNRSFKGRGLLRASVLIPWAIPTAVTAKLWYFMFDSSGIVNHVFHTSIVWKGDQWPSRFAIIIADVWKTTPFMALLILAGLQLISADVYEAARVDGATAWQRFTQITLPLVRPALMVAVLFRTLDVLRMYDLPAILTGGANGTTTLSILVISQLRSSSAFNSAAALSTITFLIIFGVAFIFVKFLGANVVENQDAQKGR